MIASFLFQINDMDKDIKLKKFYPLAMINITNRCTLKCKHCFVFREENPNTPTEKNEMPTEIMIKEIGQLVYREVCCLSNL